MIPSRKEILLHIKKGAIPKMIMDKSLKMLNKTGKSTSHLSMMKIKKSKNHKNQESTQNNSMNF